DKSSGEIKKILSEDVENIELFVAHHLPDVVAGVALPLLTICYRPESTVPFTWACYLGGEF
ncbi:MAG: hypothetical protein U9Q68_02815, partial [Euryarchaeota archaeon]|nr:hypothetical protein [Euryarchaeota archaeon]